jgi:hypothetical protein
VAQRGGGLRARPVMRLTRRCLPGFGPPQGHSCFGRPTGLAGPRDLVAGLLSYLDATRREEA